jgi:hypothetical protein
MDQWDHSWYRPGNWALPSWWTAGVPMRVGYKPTAAEQAYFYDSPFVRNVLGHSGGMTTLPATTPKRIT